jgi:hypothetical protein
LCSFFGHGCAETFSRKFQQGGEINPSLLEMSGDLNTAFDVLEDKPSNQRSLWLIGDDRRTVFKPFLIDRQNKRAVLSDSDVMRLVPTSQGVPQVG